MAILTIILFIVFLWLLHRNSLSLAKGLSEYFILCFLHLVSTVIPVGYLLSGFTVINKPVIFALALCAVSGLLYFVIRRNFELSSYSLKGLLRNAKQKLQTLWQATSLIQKIIFAVLTLTLAICTLINIVVLFISYPNEWDSMTGHLVKCAYYLQNGNMDRLQGTTWSIDYYPNSLPTLQIFGYHIFGEKGFKLIHFLSYWAFVVTSYGIAKQLFRTNRGALFVGFMAALLPPALIQAVTTETDIVQSAYLGMVVYFLLKVYKDSTWLNVVYLILASSVWVSHKVTFLLIGPAIFILVVYLLIKSSALRKKAPLTILLFLAGLSIYVLPNGYLGNLKEAEKFSLGALSAPPEVMEWHGISNYSTADKIKNLKLNLFRYSSDFLQLDGLRNTELGQNINETFRILPNMVLKRFDLERNEFWVVYPFEMMGNKQAKFFKERPYWGIMSFLLVFPVILWILVYVLRRKKSKSKAIALVFMFAGTIHFLSLCFSAPYDPIKGRYFMNMAVWCLPLLAWYFRRGKGMTYILLCSVFICVSAIFTLSHRSLYPLVDKNSVFKIGRIAQMTLTRPESTEAYQNFEKLVPKDAVVALGTQQEHEDYVYPLWGSEFKRKLIPIHPFRSVVKPIPDEAEFLFYSEGVIDFMEGDILLGEGDVLPDTPVEESKFFLRKL